MAERHVRGAIVNELGAGSRFAHELVAHELRAAGVFAATAPVVASGFQPPASSAHKA